MRETEKDNSQQQPATIAILYIKIWICPQMHIINIGNMKKNRFLCVHIYMHHMTYFLPGPFNASSFFERIV
jgi:hypothetical protein